MAAPHHLPSNPVISIFGHPPVAMGGGELTHVVTAVGAEDRRPREPFHLETQLGQYQLALALCRWIQLPADPPSGAVSTMTGLAAEIGQMRSRFRLNVEKLVEWRDRTVREGGAAPLPDVLAADARTIWPEIEYRSYRAMPGVNTSPSTGAVMAREGGGRGTALTRSDDPGLPFAWGYNGGGSIELARAVLADMGFSPRQVVAARPAVTRLLAAQPAGGWELPASRFAAVALTALGLEGAAPPSSPGAPSEKLLG